MTSKVLNKILFGDEDVIGTTQDNIGMRETPTELVSVTQSICPSVNRVPSETPTEPVNEDTTILISTSPPVRN